MFKIQESKTKTLFLFIISIALIIYCNAHNIHQNDNMEQRVKRESDENPKNTTVVQELTSKENLPFLVSVIQHLVPGIHFTIITVLYNFMVKVLK
ncbi:hypothetical protein G9C98_002881 [Cotesia typhae]|uniref:Uncharacterized protein n=1 Tax=Cotesia typhae TaxID=2053667 RepID=A0A8J5R933_9HYME|nr:hypothetical protein G9C98_002881 [Cotesia typhae]